MPSARLCLRGAAPLLLALALGVAFAGAVHAAQGRIRVGVLEEAGNPAHAAAREAFLLGLAAMAAPGVSSPHILPEGALLRAAPGDMDRAAETLAARGGLDVILVSGRAGLGAVMRAGTGKTPVFCLTGDCVAPLGPSPAPDGGISFFPARIWLRRLDELRGATGFARLGVILSPETAPTEAAVLATMLPLLKERGAEIFPFEGLPSADAAGCREAVDSLFFDEIDALLLDGSACFAKGRADLEELMGLLRSRGILPLSLMDPTAAERGALVSPWAGDEARTARRLAREFRNSPLVVTEFANLFSPDAGAPSAPDGSSYYILNLDTAEAMGFDPPVSLLAMTMTYARAAAGAAGSGASPAAAP